MAKKGETGFTLVEVLAALLIFSTAILGLMHAGTENLKAITVVENKQIAGIVADNQLILALTTGGPPNVGTRQDTVGMAGRKWAWEIKTEPTDTPDFFRLTASIRESGRDHIIISRTAFTGLQVNPRDN